MHTLQQKQELIAAPLARIEQISSNLRNHEAKLLDSLPIEEIQSKEIIALCREEKSIVDYCIKFVSDFRARRIVSVEKLRLILEIEEILLSKKRLLQWVQDSLTAYLDEFRIDKSSESSWVQIKKLLDLKTGFSEMASSPDVKLETRFLQVQGDVRKKVVTKRYKIHFLLQRFYSDTIMVIKYEIQQIKDKLQISLELVSDLVQPLTTSALRSDALIPENYSTIDSSQLPSLNSDLQSLVTSLVFDLKLLTEIPLPFGN